MSTASGAVPPPSEEDLMARFLDCDDEAFDELAERLRPWLQGVIRRRGVSWHDAEDLAEDTLVRLFRQKPSGPG